MVEILKQMIDRYLQLLSNRVEDQETFDNMVKVEKSMEASLEERCQAEAYIKQETRRHGEMVVHGDQLTVARIESAKRISKSSLTMLGRLELVKVVVTGMFHADMNMIIYDYKVREASY